MIVKGKGVPIPKKDSYLAAFKCLPKDPEDKDSYSTSSIAEKYGVEVDVNWLNGEKRDFKIPDSIVTVFDTIRKSLNDEKLYDKITMDNGDIVFLLYWNLLAENEFNVWHCLPLICKDCDIDTDATIQETSNRHIL